MTKKIDQNLIQQLIEQAAASPRLRSNINFHSELDDPVQRLFIGLKKGTYVKPHNHPMANKWELMLAVHGEMVLVLFTEDGTIQEKITIGAGEPVMGAEMPPSTWHTIYPASADAVLLEVKAGPYTPATPSDFAPWAPDEGESAAQVFLQWLEQAKIGEHYSTA